MILAILSVSLNPLVLPQAQATADYYRCANKESGEWNYGRAPMACSANSFGDDSVIYNSYAQTIFSDVASRTPERHRYLGELHAVVRDAAQIYILKRNPAATRDEIKAWTDGVVSTAAHESYWSQYRKTTDGRLKMMRGDSGHGHGIMQIDDRSHFPAVSKGIAWNLISHLTYAMDIFYTGWNKAKSQSCVKTAANYWQARIRAAWAAYNGGLGQVCRWSNSNSSWSQNDKNFYTILTQHAWTAFVSDLNQKTTIPVGCLMENKENCAATAGTDPDPKIPQEAHFYRVAGQLCLVKNQIFQCVEQERDRDCLRSLGPVASEDVVEWTAAQAAAYTKHVQDRHLLCSSYDRILIPVGSGVRFLKAITLRDTPGGGSLGIVPVKTVLQVRDFELRGTTGDRYYRVAYAGKEGYVYGGDLQSNSTWLSSVTSSFASTSTMARVGDRIQVINKVGINLRDSEGGVVLLTIPVSALVKVEALSARTAENKLYYKVTYKSKTGYIYVGSLLPTDGLPAWTKVVGP